MDLITTHTNADFDCIGSMVAASRLYPGAVISFPGSQEKSVRDFFQKSPLAKEFISTKPKEIDLDAVTRLVIVDCQHTSRIGRFAELLDRGIEVHIFDHHSNGDIIPTGGVIRECGSSSSILTKILMEKGIEVSPTEATMIMLGIYEDTGNLTFPSTSRDDYEAAAWLLDHGASLRTVSDFVTQELTPAQISLLNDLLKTLKTITVNGVDISIAHASADYYIGDIAVLAHMMRDMENLEAVFLAVDMGKRIYLVGRSRIPEVDAGEVLRLLGGGGHHGAASATIRDMTLIETLRRLEDILRERVNPARVASDIMSSPVKTIPAETVMREARDLLIRYNVNAMPVMQGEKMLGVITRRIAEKALYHGLADVSVCDYMNTEFMRAAPATPIAEIQEYIVGHNRRFVPVFEGNTLVGAITRTDLLRFMYAGLRAREEQAYDLGPGEVAPRKRNLSPVIMKLLPQRVTTLLRDLGMVGGELDLPVYAVGGFVRDLILGVPNIDVDVTVEGDGILFAETFAARFGCRVKSHRKFDTAVIVFPDGMKIDVASTRLEYYRTPGALPTVERSSLKMDLYRRDFTINTLAVRLDGGDFGLLVDYFGGQRDIRDRTIRVLHNLSFVEDPTRVFRAIRFELRLAFRLSPHTEHLISNAVKMNFLDRLGGKRLLTELVNIFRENEPVAAVERMSGLGVLHVLHPALHFDHDMRRMLDESRRVVDWFDLLFLDRPYHRWAVHFLALTDDLSQEEFLHLCIRLAVAEQYREKLVDNRQKALSVLLEFEARDRRGEEPRNSDIYFHLHDLPIEVLLYMMSRTEATGVRRIMSTYFTHLQDISLSISGTDLLHLGLPHGPLFRDVLDHVLASKLNGEVASHEEELRLAGEQIAALVAQKQHPDAKKRH